tara:strand:+ start:273 stop:482 length:210 start_codon:yes stop_codon:yes gene_type:complete
MIFVFTVPIFSYVTADKITDTSQIQTPSAIDADGSGRTSNGGSIKYFYDSFSGTNPSSDGYTYNAGQGS